MLPWISSRSSDRWLFCALLGVTFVSATAIVAYHASTIIALFGGLVYTIIFGVFAVWLLHRPQASSIQAVLRSPALWLLLLLLMAVIDQRHYLRAKQIPNFTTSAEALERPARLLLHGEEPYRYLVGGLPAGPAVDNPPLLSS